jgi:hypothetical protein
MFHQVSLMEKTLFHFQGSSAERRDLRPVLEAPLNVLLTSLGALY